MPVYPPRACPLFSYVSVTLLIASRVCIHKLGTPEATPKWRHKKCSIRRELKCFSKIWQLHKNSDCQKMFYQYSLAYTHWTVLMISSDNREHMEAYTHYRSPKSSLKDSRDHFQAWMVTNVWCAAGLEVWFNSIGSGRLMTSISWLYKLAQILFHWAWKWSRKLNNKNLDTLFCTAAYKPGWLTF